MAQTKQKKAEEDHVKLKHLRKSELEKAKDKQRICSRTVNDLKTEVISLESEIAQFTSSDQRIRIRISEHAILRYIERVMGIDIEEVKSKIVPEDQIDTITHFGGGSFPIDGFRIRVRNNTVVTVLTDINEKD